MNKIGILLLGALSLLANPPCFSQSKTFYLSPQGKDKTDGSLNKPWKTASHAFQQINQITHGDITLIVQDGDYFLSDSLALNGKNHNGRITIMAANKGKANFIGYRTLTKFSTVKSKTERNCFAPNVQGHILRAKLRKAGIIDYLQAATEHNRFELYLNGKRQQLSRWPNDSSVQTGTVLGKTIDTKNKSIVEGFFKYTNSYIDKFATDDDLYLHGYFCYKWFDNIERVAEIDKINRTITIAKPYHHYGYKEGCDFYVLNSMSEVDEPGEYYVDRKNGYLYWYPPATFNPRKDHVIVPVFKDANMLTIENGSHITIDGISFIGGSNGAISITEGDHVKIENCRISQFGACAITINGGKDHTVYNCKLEELGQEGIVANGGDRKTLENSGFLFSNNTIKDFSLYRDTYRQGLVFYGCGVTISHNLFANSPSSALGLGGNNITVEYNVFKDAVKKSNDQGVIDIYLNPSFRGIIIRNNYFKDIVGTDKLDMVAAVRLDDMISGAAIYNNVFDNCGSSHFGAVQIHGGKDNHVFNNLFYHCLGCFSQSAWGKEKWLKTLDTANMKKLIYEDVDINSALYKKNYPELETSIRENADQNFFNDNLFVDTPNQYRRISSNCVIKNNQDVSSQQSVQEFCNSTTLKTYGLTGIDLKLCGPMITTPLP
jgi:hypothetical protein